MNGVRFRWDHDLAGPAKRIAELNHTPMRVMAGPGTGKTFALMRRVARLLQDGVPADRILVCTFTRTAARDLQRNWQASVLPVLIAFGREHSTLSVSVL